MGDDVMDDAAIAGTNFDSADVAILTKIGRDDEATVDIAAFGAQLVSLGWFDDCVRLTQRPAFGKFGKRRQIGGIAFRSARAEPILEQADLLCREMPLVAKLAKALLRFPRRHDVLTGDTGDLFGPLGDVAVTQQRKWRDFP